MGLVKNSTLAPYRVGCRNSSIHAGTDWTNRWQPFRGKSISDLRKKYFCEARIKILFSVSLLVAKILQIRNRWEFEMIRILEQLLVKISLLELDCKYVFVNKFSFFLKNQSNPYFLPYRIRCSYSLLMQLMYFFWKILVIVLCWRNKLIFANVCSICIDIWWCTRTWKSEHGK